MTQDEIIEMAIEAGGSTVGGPGWITWVGTQSTEFLERFANLVAKHTLSNIDPSMKPYGYVRKDGEGLFIYGEHQFQNQQEHELVPVYLKEALAQTEQEPVEPPWWPAVENILNEYGLQAIDFVADFKNGLAQTEQEQEPIGYLCENAVGHRYFRWKKPPSTYKPIPLYTKENT